jgi:hypothetical protein
VTFRDESSGDTEKQAGSGSPPALPSTLQERATVDVASCRSPLLSRGSQVRVLPGVLVERREVAEEFEGLGVAVARGSREACNTGAANEREFATAGSSRGSCEASGSWTASTANPKRRRFTSSRR